MLTVTVKFMSARIAQHAATTIRHYAGLALHTNGRTEAIAVEFAHVSEAVRIDNSSIHRIDAEYEFGFKSPNDLVVHHCIASQQLVSHAETTSVRFKHNSGLASKFNGVLNLEVANRQSVSFASHE